MATRRVPSAANSPPLTRSRTLEQLGKIGSLDSALVLEGGDQSLTPAKSLLRQMEQVYPKAVCMGSDPPASSGSLPSPGTGKLDRRKRFRGLEQNPDHYAAPLGGELLSGLFDKVDDEVIVEIMHLLVKLPKRAELRLGVHECVLRGARDLRNLLLCCRRMRIALTHAGALLHKEMTARAATQIVPAAGMLSITRHPFTEQVRSETRSSEQLRSLRTAIDGMATHCAGPCCERSRKEVNRHKTRLWTVSRRSTLVAPSAGGDCAYVSSRCREGMAKKRLHNREETQRAHAEYIVKNVMNEEGCHEATKFLLEDLDQFSAPQSMRTSQCGLSVALIRAVHSQAPDESIPHSVVSVLDVFEGAEPNMSEVVEPPDEAEDIGAINAQDAWWVDDFDEIRLVVLWSTAYVHPMGSVVGANAENACYFIAIYNRVEYDLHEYVGPFYGKAQTVSPTTSGKEVAILVRKAPMGNGPGSLPTRCTMLHNVYSESAIEINHTGAIAHSRWPQAWMAAAHPADVAVCPSAVALSPSGDCVVAIHRRALSVLVEVLIRTAPEVFVSVQTIDVTHWTSRGGGEPTLWDAEGSHATANSLKLPYNITFSPCGRFAAILDQRPLFGLSITNHALVVLDMAYRHERRGVRACALAPVEDMAPRSIDWTSKGLWIQARYGALFLSA